MRSRERKGAFGMAESVGCNLWAGWRQKRQAGASILVVWHWLVDLFGCGEEKKRELFDRGKR